MSNQATQGSKGSNQSSPVKSSSTNAALNAYLRSTEAPINAQLVGATGTVSTVSSTTQRASYCIQNVSSQIFPNGHANQSTGR